MSSRVAAAAEAFEINISSAEGARRSAAASTRRNVVLEGPDGLLGGGSDAAAGSGNGRGSQVPRPPPPPPLSRLAALNWEDIEGRRILLHVDLSRGVVEGAVESSDRGGGGVSVGVTEGNGNGSSGDPLQPFPEAVRLVAEQVREMLSAKPAAVVIVSEMAPPSAAVNLTSTAEQDGAPSNTHPSADTHPSAAAADAEITKNEQHSLPISAAPEAVSGLPESTCYSLRSSAAAVASLLGMEVDFYDSVPDLASVLERCVKRSSGRGDSSGGDGGGGGGGGGSLPAFGMVPLMMVEQLSLPGVVPAPPVEEPDLSDGEEERLPDFLWGGEGVCRGTLQWNGRSVQNTR